MPRKPRLDVPGTLHHIMIRGIERTLIFQDEEDRNNFVNRMRYLVKETGTRMLAWALLTNHIHLLVVSGPVGLSSFMRRLLTGYAIRFNKKYRRFGHLFQNRYKSIICDMDPYLLELVRYIHLNPERTVLLKQPSSYLNYLGKSKQDWVKPDFILQNFAKRGFNSYQAFVESDDSELSEQTIRTISKIAIDFES